MLPGQETRCSLTGMDLCGTGGDLYFILLSGLSFTFVLHLLSGEQSRGRRVLLKVFAKWVELPLLRIIYEACRGRLRFLTRRSPARTLMGAAVALPFAKYMDTGVPVPKKHVMKLIETLDGPIAVGDCRCRLAKKTCGHPMLTDMVFRTGAEAWLWAFPDNYRPIEKEEAKRIVNQCAELGMFHMVFIHCSSSSHVNEYVICNCCECGCKVHLLNRTVGQRWFPLPDGGFRSFLEADKCDLCGECVEACPFDAIRMRESGIEVADCFGCGVCEQVCQRGAFKTIRVTAGPPWAQEAWRML